MIRRPFKDTLRAFGKFLEDSPGFYAQKGSQATLTLPLTSEFSASVSIKRLIYGLDLDLKFLSAKTGKVLENAGEIDYDCILWNQAFTNLFEIKKSEVIKFDRVSDGLDVIPKNQLPLTRNGNPAKLSRKRWIAYMHQNQNKTPKKEGT